MRPSLLMSSQVMPPAAGPQTTQRVVRVMGHKLKDEFTLWSIPLDCDISVSFWQLQCLFSNHVCLSAGAIALSSLSRGCSIVAHSGPHSLQKGGGCEGESRGCRGENTGGGNCLQQAPRIEVASAAIDTVLRIVRHLGNPEAKTNHHDFFGNRSQNFQCQLLKASSV